MSPEDYNSEDHPQYRTERVRLLKLKIELFKAKERKIDKRKKWVNAVTARQAQMYMDYTNNNLCGSPQVPFADSGVPSADDPTSHKPSNPPKVPRVNLKLPAPLLMAAGSKHSSESQGGAALHKSSPGSANRDSNPNWYQKMLKISRLHRDGSQESFALAGITTFENTQTAQTRIAMRSNGPKSHVGSSEPIWGSFEVGQRRLNKVRSATLDWTNKMCLPGQGTTKCTAVRGGTPFESGDQHNILNYKGLRRDLNLSRVWTKAGDLNIYTDREQRNLCNRHELGTDIETASAYIWHQPHHTTHCISQSLRDAVDPRAPGRASTKPMGAGRGKRRTCPHKTAGWDVCGTSHYLACLCVIRLEEEKVHEWRETVDPPAKEMTTYLDSYLLGLGSADKSVFVDRDLKTRMIYLNPTVRVFKKHARTSIVSTRGAGSGEGEGRRSGGTMMEREVGDGV
ncbi:hypothetical protein DFH07DRAFT_785680 [Mycena maculata]|uniref:Uncharacterized protein n=1 Tax=Mycena maculata TaxID=230809 RepID=A0AAD7H9E1_9AGAR|nr:hypothetical protein DFH07DRAFT_785680 [Mycena maculata]